MAEQKNSYENIFCKVFKDPLYDYIKIDNDICEKIIDNKYFQRLRRIEQTSMRCLYPSARHDRFIHSIGVYHLAKIAINALKNNEKVDLTKENLDFPDEKIQKNLAFSFEMAALLHDVGHSPFSHTLEKYFQKEYDYNVDGTDVIYRDIIDVLFDETRKINKLTGNEITVQFEAECKKANAAPHEIVSCIIVLRCFKDILDELAAKRDCKIDYLFLVRCILGAQYTDINHSFSDYKNCIIRILNSSIDVDKLDYISRDSSISGFANTKVDTKRLLSSLIFVKSKGLSDKPKLCLAFKKTALGVIQNVVTSRNSLYTWVYSHHKVKYEGYLIQKAIELIADEEEKQSNYKINRNIFITSLFSVKSIEENLVCDDVIWNLFIKHKNIPEVNEIIQRNSQKKAIWKSFAEFQAYFDTATKIAPVGGYSADIMRKYLENNSSISCLKNYINKFDPEMKFEVVSGDVKLAYFKPKEILVYINDDLFFFDDIFGELYGKSQIPSFFYIYCDKETKRKLNIINSNTNKKKKYELIEYIKKYKEFQSTVGC